MDVVRDKVHETGRGQIMKTFQCQLNCLNPILEAVKDLNSGSNMNRVVFFDDNSQFLMEDRLEKSQGGQLGDCYNISVVQR